MDLDEFSEFDIFAVSLLFLVFAVEGIDMTLGYFFAVSNSVFFRKTMGEFLRVCPKRLCISTVGTRTDLFARDPSKVPITDFFGSVRNVELSQRTDNFTVSANAKKQNPDSKEESKTKMYSYPPQLPILQSFE